MNILSLHSPLTLRHSLTSRISALWFYITFFLYTFSMTLSVAETLRTQHKDILHMLTTLTWICTALCIINILFLCDYTVGQTLLLLAIVVIFYISYKTSGSRHLFQGILLVLSAKNVQWKTFVKTCFSYYLFYLIVFFICNRAGLFLSDNLTRNGRIRVDLGFTHPNAFGGYLMILCILWASIRYEHIRWYDYVLLIVVTAYNWIGPNSRTGTMITVLLLIMLPIMRRFGNTLFSSKLFQALCLSSYFLAFLVSVVASYAYDGSQKILSLINTLFSGRIFLAHTFLEHYDPVLWGQRVRTSSAAASKILGGVSAILDNAYVHLLLQSGIIPTLVALAVLTAAVFYALRSKNGALLLALILFAIYGILEFRITKITFNVFWISFAFLFQSKGSKPESSSVGSLM